MKIKIHRLLILAILVTFFQLLTPNGKILCSIGSFNITLGSLKAGLTKSGILIFLQLLSKFIVSFNIKFPGKTGAFLTDVFFIYGRLTEAKNSTEEKDLTSDKHNTQIPPDETKLDRFILNLDRKLSSVWKQF